MIKSIICFESQLVQSQTKAMIRLDTSHLHAGSPTASGESTESSTEIDYSTSIKPTPQNNTEQVSVIVLRLLQNPKTPWLGIQLRSILKCYTTDTGCIRRSVVGFSVVVEFFRTGLVLRLPSAILAAVLCLTGLLSISVGLILNTLARNFEELTYQILNLDRQLRELPVNHSFTIRREPR